MVTIEHKLAHLHARIDAACVAAARPSGSVRLLAVSKTFGGDAVRAAYAAGEHSFGENYVQEGIDKIAQLSDLRGRIEWHLIGPLQSNKTRVVAEQFDWVQSVDRLKIAQRLSEQRPAGLPPLQVCLQVNISGEASKSGFLPSGLCEAAHAVAQLPRLALRGLMAIPEPSARHLVDGHERRSRAGHRRRRHAGAGGQRDLWPSRLRSGDRHGDPPGVRRGNRRGNPRGPSLALATRRAGTG